MFGTFRFTLSLMVVAFHFASAFEFQGAKPFAHLGQFAVYGFFVVSGFVMTLVLNETYHFSGGRFWLNRLLRLYPAYLLVAALTVGALLVWPEAMARYHAAFHIRLHWLDIAGNLSVWIFPFYKADFRLVPPAWSIGVELVMYFLLFLFVARRPRNALLSLLVGAGYFLLAAHPGLKWDRYFSVFAAFLPFSAGAALYFAGKRLPPFRQTEILGGLGGLVALWLLLGWTAAGDADYMLLFHWNLLVMAGMVFLLAQLRASPPHIQRVDRFFGDLAYPVFLLHWIIGFFVLQASGAKEDRGIVFLGQSLPFILGAAVLVVLLVDRPLASLRDRVRGELRS